MAFRNVLHGMWTLRTHTPSPVPDAHKRSAHQTRLSRRRHARTALLYPPHDEQNDQDEHDGAKYAAADVHVCFSSVSMCSKTWHGFCATRGHEPLAHHA